MTTRRVTKQVNTTLEDEIRSDYFQWLCHLAFKKRPYRGQIGLAEFLHDTEFVVKLAKDNNRASDGVKLRETFSDDTLESDCACLDGPCTMLELLVSLSIRMDHILYNVSKGRQSSKWFGDMIRNMKLQLLDENDPDYDLKIRHNERVLKKVLERRCTSYGRGGIFPLRNAYQDQREVEIWYQMMAWIDENYPS